MMILHALFVSLGLLAQKSMPMGLWVQYILCKKNIIHGYKLSWERPKLPMPSLFLGQTEACGGEKNYFNLRSDLPLIVGIRWVGLVPPLLVDLNLPVLLIFAAHECLKLSLFSRKELGRIWPFLSFSVHYFNNNNWPVFICSFSFLTSAVYVILKLPIVSHLFKFSNSLFIYCLL